MLSFLRNVKGKCFFLDSKLFLHLYLRLAVAQGHKRVTINATGCGFDFHSRILNIFISSYVKVS